MNYTNKEITDLIQKTTRETIRQMLAEGLIDRDRFAYRLASDELTRFFQDGAKDERLRGILHELRSDEYIKIITLFFENGYTIEHIAEVFDVDPTTISRNKKRLCLAIYDAIERSRE